MNIPQGSPSYKKRNPHLFKPDPNIFIPQGVGIVSTVVKVEKPPKRIRQSDKPLLNKLEYRFKSEILTQMYTGYRVVEQGMRVKIGNGSWFKCDFYVPALHVAHEVKGPAIMRNQQSRQLLALKTAAYQWPEITWWLHWFEKGEWHKQRVMA